MSSRTRSVVVARRNERGFSLIIAVAIVTLLVTTGMIVLDAIYTDSQLAGGDNASQNAMYLAEAGAIWGKQQLVNMMWPDPNASNTAAPNVSTLAAYPTLNNGDQICAADNSPCSSWHSLVGLTNYPTSVSPGTYRVAAACNPNCDATVQSFTIRSYGHMGDSNRMVEITVGQQ